MKYHHVGPSINSPFVSVDPVGPPPSWVVGEPDFEDAWVMFAENGIHHALRMFKNTASRNSSFGNIEVNTSQWFAWSSQLQKPWETWNSSSCIPAIWPNAFGPGKSLYWITCHANNSQLIRSPSLWLDAFGPRKRHRSVLVVGVCCWAAYMYTWWFTETRISQPCIWPLWILKWHLCLLWNPRMTYKNI